ncbi:MAG TPA: hypothetical protein EYQ50_14295 [Verrucomicrobiales bacterium]|nr:hypothetical protein [Verrucomicrobiales bacterium]HIL69375.1 hypothetical protein [Verrucomicrobiota bacterium]
MRIVEYEKDTASLNYQVIKGIGIVACVLSIVVVILMIANTVNLTNTDPIHSPTLLKLLDDLKGDPQNKELRKEIQDLDLIARQAFFTSQRFNQVAIWLVLGALVVMIAAFKSIETFKWRFPYPDGRDPKDDIIANAKWARKSITYAGLVLLGFALILALPWKSPLDVSKEESLKVTANDNGSAIASSDLAASPKGKVETVQKKPVYPTLEEKLTNWPNFLGAAYGVLPTTEVPIHWDGETGEGIVWKTALPKTGFSSPIIWDDKLFLSGADKEVREIYCIDRETGKSVWTKQVDGIPGSPAEPPRVSSDTGYAASTMATDGSRIFAIFSTGDIISLDVEGKQIWGRNLGVPDNPYGHASSLVIHEDLLLVQYDQSENGRFLGLDIQTGDTRWETKRDLDSSWASPLLVNTGERLEVILAAEPAIVSYDPNNGKELWRMPGLEGGEVAPTPLFADGLLYVAADYVKLEAINVHDQSVVWLAEDLIPGVSTPIVSGKFLFYGLSDGGFGCYDAKSGKELWNEESDEGFYASPIVVGEKVYLMDRGGIMHIFAAKEEYESIGNPALGEISVTTPVIVDNSIYYRGLQHLYRIGS